MNFIIKFLLTHWGYKLRADTIYAFINAVPTEELIIYIEQLEER
jgi:hypothetical protein